ncbi:MULTISPECIES: hypothetical protein [Streptomyces]|uniref:Transcriptional regulator n=1 Tax=Streptomyces griseosporeus TaxID=1910 RepID=A0ABV3KZT5_STRGS|nr:hypothetical protein [Streptomyces actuosus]MBM4824032.1 hypothetical protein [Streptomyces actuosus]
MTAGLREAMDDVRRSVAVLAARVHDAHAARVWVPLGHGSWESYCAAEFGISRAQAYRLLDVARSLTAIHGDYGLSQRAMIAVSGRSGDVAELLPPTRRARSQRPPALDEATVRAVVRQAVRDIRTAPPPPPAVPPADPAVAALRRVVDEPAASAHVIGELMLEVAPAYLSDTDAADALALSCEEIGEPLEQAAAITASRDCDMIRHDYAD